MPGTSSVADFGDAKTASVIYALKAIDIAGSVVDFAKYQGDLLIIFNVPLVGETKLARYMDNIRALHHKYHVQGVRILLFLCDQFICDGDSDNVPIYRALHDAHAIDLFDKVDVNLSQAHPVFQFLKRGTAAKFGATILNKCFTFFVVNREGRPVSRQRNFVALDLTRMEEILREHM